MGSSAVAVTRPRGELALFPDWGVKDALGHAVVKPQLHLPR